MTADNKEPAEGDARLREALDKFVPHAPGLGHDQTKYPGIPWPGACIRCSIERHVALSGEPSSGGRHQ